MNMYAWRVLVTLPDGSTVEPFHMFNANRTGGADTQALGSTRLVQAMIYGISYFAVTKDQSMHNQLDVLLDCAMTRAGGKSATIVVSSLDRPFDAWHALYSRGDNASPHDAKSTARSSTPNKPLNDLFAIGVLALLGITLTARHFGRLTRRPCQKGSTSAAKPDPFEESPRATI
jgi:hypothetical protein